MFKQDPDRQSRRDRLPRHPHGAAAWASRRSPSIPTPTPTRCTCARPTRRCASARRRRRRAISSIDKIVEACKQTGAEAVHPGYGFLSENRHSPRRWRRRASSSSARRRTRSRRWATRSNRRSWPQEAGVNTVPGYLGVIEDADEAVKIAKRDRLSGDDQGLRRRRRQGHAHRAQRRTRRARASAPPPTRRSSSFGDDRVFIEKYIEEPRHIEIQVLGDAHGNIIYLGERECSIQRRHQKVIEEAPSPFLDEKTRAGDGRAGGRAGARRCNTSPPARSSSSSTRKRNFYFLEMNTRLQVEHPVTELVTGLDLVELMIRVAAGEKLPLTQERREAERLGDRGARLCRGSARATSCRRSAGWCAIAPPQEAPAVRVDTGVYEGGEISMYLRPDDRQAGAPTATIAPSAIAAHAARRSTPSTSAASATTCRSCRR